MDFVGAAWQWIDDSAGALGAVATIAAAVVAVVTLVNAGRDSRDRSRPYLVAEHRFAEDSDSTIDLVVRNAGLSVARAVHVSFDPPPAVPDTGGPFLTSFLLMRYGSALPTLAPGQALSNIWWSGHAVVGGSNLENSEPTPDRCTVSIEYEDDRGRRYSDVFELDVTMLLSGSYAVSSTSFKGRLKTMDQSLKEISAAVTTLAKRRAAND